MIPATAIDPLGIDPADRASTVARNLSTRYLAIAIDAALGVMMLPFNIAHLGKAGYGLWVLTTSVTAYFSLLDMGYSGALVKFVAQYRTRRDSHALNEILSTLFHVFVACSAVMYLVAIVIAMNITHVFHLGPEQAGTARIVLLVVSINVAMTTIFSVYGAVINGFQRYDLNNIVGTLCSIVAAMVNVVVLMLGFGLVELVVATTATRVLTLLFYRANAYRVFPGLDIRTRLFRRARLREVTGFSAHMAIIDWANRLNYSIDTLVIGAFMNTAAVAIWAVAQRLAELVQRLANQLNEILFPAVVENDTAARLDRLQRIFIDGTRLTLAAVLPMGIGLILLARPLVSAWVGPTFSGSAEILQILGLVVIVRIGCGTGMTILKGAGQHRLLAATNAVTAVVNVALSVWLIGPLHELGVALGTLIPVGLASLLVIFPTACRRVELPLRTVFARAVWPPFWPTLVMSAFIVSTTSLVPSSLLAVGIEYSTAMLIYAITFVMFTMPAAERRFFRTKVLRVLPLQRMPTASEVL